MSSCYARAAAFTSYCRAITLVSLLTIKLQGINTYYPRQSVELFSPSRGEWQEAQVSQPNCDATFFRSPLTWLSMVTLQVVAVEADGKVCVVFELESGGQARKHVDSADRCADTVCLHRIRNLETMHG